MPRTHDRVVVVGAGPVGSVAALLLGQAGIPVTLLEREPERVIDYRASTIHPPTLDLLEKCGATGAMLEMGLIAPTMQYRDRHRGKIAEFDMNALQGDTRHPYRLQCEQFKLVGWCYDEFARTGAVDLRFSHRVAGIQSDEDGITLSVETPGGPQRISCDYLIGCDGGRSDTRKALGIGFDGFTYPEHFLVSGTRFDFKSAMPDICSVNYTADPDEWYLLLQIPDMWRILLPVDPAIEPEAAVQEESIQNALQNLLPRSEPYEIVVRAIYRVSQRVAATYRAGNAFLAGDAAHINNPIGGVGLNGGLHDAIDLTTRLAAVWHGKDGETLLDGYETRRRPVAIDAINAMTQRNKKVLEERDPEVRRRNLAEWARIASDPDLAYQHMLQTSMIASLRKSGMI
jgi:3-(3-hydroxy-phenyl)propionate hydroxylase